MDIDRHGVVWTPPWSGHMASFDRRKCQGPLNGPEATGQHCPEGWTFYQEPIPQFTGVTAPGSAGSATTRGSTSSIRSGSATTSRSTRARGPRDCSRSKTASGSCCVCLTRWGSTPSGWTAGSTIRTGLEGPRPVGHLREPRAVAHGDGPGHDAQGAALPAAAGPAGQVRRDECLITATREAAIGHPPSRPAKSRMREEVHLIE